MALVCRHLHYNVGFLHPGALHQAHSRCSVNVYRGELWGTGKVRISWAEGREGGSLPGAHLAASVGLGKGFKTSRGNVGSHNAGTMWCQEVPDLWG